MSIEAMKQALEVLENAWLDASMGKGDVARHTAAITSLRQAIAEAEKQEPVAVKHMMEWVNYLKRKSDYGQHMQIPSEMSAGACWELAIELEQFIKQSPPQHQWVGLTDEEVEMIVENKRADPSEQVRYVEAKLKDKNIRQDTDCKYCTNGCVACDARRQSNVLP